MMKRSRFAWLAGTVLAATSGWAIAQQHAMPAPPKVTFASHSQAIPFELFRGNRIVIPAVINGHSSEVMLDTGASTTTLDRAYARKIGLPAGRKITGRGAGGTVEAEIVHGVTLEVGGMRFDDMTVGVMDLAPIARTIGRPLNVIVGREFFNSAVVSIDWSSSQLRVASHESFRPSPDATVMKLGRNGPFNTIPVSVAGGAPIDALLDVGNGSALVIPQTRWSGEAKLSSLRYAEGRSGGVGGLHASRNVTIPQVSLAGRSFANVPAVLALGGNDHDPTKMTNVGIGLLKQFRVDLDLGRDRLYLAPRPDAPPFERDRAGARLELLGDRLRVAFVSPQGPAAAAGLKDGEEIVAVDARKVTPDYYKGGDWTRGPAGTAVTLHRSDGSTVTVTLQDYF